MNANTENKHMTPKGEMPMCATACATQGIPAAVLKGGKAGGDIVVLVTPAPALASHMAKEVRVSGVVPFAGSMIPEKIEVREKGKWIEVKIGTMM